jgi:hypothetical protein
MQVKDFKKNINVTIFNPNKSLHGKILVKMVHKIGTRKMICCKLTYFQPALQYQKKLIVLTVYFFRSKNDSCLTFKNVENVVGATD